MMKKVLYGVAMAFVALLTFGSLQSCKDDLSDLRHQTEFDVANLQYQIDRVKLVLKDSLEQHRREIDQNRGDINKLLKALELYATIHYVDSCDSVYYHMLAKNDSILKDSLDTLKNRLNASIKRLNDRVDDHQLRIDTLDTLIHNYYTELSTNLAIQKKSIDTIKGTLKEISARQDRDSLRIDSLYKIFTKLKESTDSVFNEVFKEGGLKDQVGVLKQRVDSIDAQLDNIYNRFDDLITGILIQAVKSPVFGSFSAPIGLKNNMLFNFYGKNVVHDAFEFPNNSTTYSAGGDPTGITFGGDKVPINASYYEDEISLGDVYVTLNPIGHYFNNTPLKLQNSKGETLSIKVTVNPSNDLLTFGYTRGDGAEIKTGLYKGAAKLDMANVKEVEFAFDESFAKTIKDAVSNPTKSAAVDVLKAVYQQLNGKFAAYALRYDWDVTEPQYDLAKATTESKSYSVLSQYDLAVVAARPYGFNTLAGFGTSKELPTIGHIDNFISELLDRALNKFNLEGKYIAIKYKGVDYEIAFESIGYATENNQLIATVTGLTVGGDPVEIAPFDCGTPKTAVENVTNKIVEAIYRKLCPKPNTDDALEAEVRTKVDIVLLEMQNQINDVVNDMNIQIKDTFNEIGDDTDKYFDKLNKAAKLYDRVAKKINAFLKNPNAYLQACAFYVNNGNVGVVSGKKSSPTPVKISGGNKLTLYLSTYTAELVAPAYKKFVAVTNVYDLDGNPKALPANINNGKNLNEVLPGEALEVPINVGSFEKDRIYEFVYQAVDYCGYTSTKKFYIQVK